MVEEKAVKEYSRPKFLRIAGIILLVPAVLIMTAWAFGAIYYSNLPTQPIRLIAAILFLCLTVGLFCIVKPFRKAFLCFFLFFGFALVCWWLIPPSNDRNWQPMSEVLVYSEIEGDEITIHNLRDFEYRSMQDYTPRYYDKTFSLSNLSTADLYLSYWGPTTIAHTMLSFGFGEQGYVCVSIETRKEVGEEYSAIKGFFKQYELLYVVGSERDLVGQRTHHKSEDLYLYRLKVEPEVIQDVFLDYFRHINRLIEKPKWYNALTHNCTTSIRGHAVPHRKRRLDWRLVVNGHLDRMLYERGDVDNSLPFEDFRKACFINDKAVKLSLDQDFSQNIREGLPGME